MDKYKITDRYTKERVKAILEIKKKKGLTAKAVVEAAKNKDSPLFDMFEWDNKKAGNKWRLQQARVLINDIKVIIEDKEYYAFENLTVTIRGAASAVGVEVKNEYFGRTEIINSTALRKQYIEKAITHLNYWRNQYKVYSEFKGIIKEIDKISEKFELNNKENKMEA